MEWTDLDQTATDHRKKGNVPLDEGLVLVTREDVNFNDLLFDWAMMLVGLLSSVN